MSKHSSDKVIPTLDDVIQHGSPDRTPVASLDTLEDEFEDDLDTFFRDDNDDPAIAEIKPDIYDDITDQIVAERFSTNDHLQQEPEPALTSLKELTQDHSADSEIEADTQKAEPQSAIVSEPEPAQKPVEASKPVIVIGELVDEITRQLMPEIEWKVRTRVREVLEQHFPDSD